MQHIKLFLIGTMIILYGGCSDSKLMTAEESQLISSEITSKLNEYPQALLDRDLNWFQNFWADDDNFVMALDGNLASDYEVAVTKTYTDFLANFENLLHFQFINGETLIIDRNTATHVTKFDWGIVTKTGDTLQSKGSGIYLFKRYSGDWKALQVAGTHQYY